MTSVADGFCAVRDAIKLSFIPMLWRITTVGLICERVLKYSELNQYFINDY